MGNPMTSQEVFDTVARHLFAQGCRSMDDSGEACMYRGTDGRKCAIGILIPDAEYTSTIEGSGIISVVERAPSLKGIDAGLMRALQLSHDSEAAWGASPAMRGRLERVADSFSLSPAILSGLSFNRPTP